jgi:hypothetical protein
VKEKILNLRKQNKTFREIQKILNCSASTIWYHISESYKQKRIARIKTSVTKARINRKHHIIQAFGGKCISCSYNTCQSALEFHHLNPKHKETRLSNIIGSCSLDKIILELKKCVLVCANCHREIHQNLRTVPNRSNFNEQLFLQTIKDTDNS